MLIVLTLLAGTHMAAFLQPSTSSETRVPYPIPIQYGPPPGWYGPYGPPPNVPRGPGWYGPRDIQPYAGGVMHPDDYRSMRRWDWEMRRGGRGYSYPVDPY